MDYPVNEWTTELRYKNYQEWPTAYLAALTAHVAKAPWRLTYHIQPETGLLNDPNGFSFFNGDWHLFYQAYPFGPVHGVKSWAHMTSKDLVNWQRGDVSLLPDSPLDSHGVYSGSALPIDDELFIMYTGNVRDEKWQRQSIQAGAWLTKQNELKKIPQALIDQPPAGYTAEFRDPQVFTYQDGYLMLIGAQDSNERGQVVVYRTTDLLDWQFLGNLNYTEKDMGFMVECPNLVEVDGQPVLLFCPQGLAKSLLAYENIYPNTYVIGSTLTMATLSMENPSDIHNLDDGFDVYATQAMTAPDGRALAVSWVGLPEISYPSFVDGWAHCLSLVKELRIKEGHLYQYPVSETLKLRQNERSISGAVKNETQLMCETSSHSFELELIIGQQQRGKLRLLANPTEDAYLEISFDTFSGKIEIDRTYAGQPFAEAYGTVRQTMIPENQDLTFNIFVDQSICEVFINKGFKVSTLRLFPQDDQRNLLILSQEDLSYEGKIWDLVTSPAE